MATTFLEPGGDADFAVTSGNGFWGLVSGSTTIATDFVHGNHKKSLSFPAGTNYVKASAVVADAGGRVSFYLYKNTNSSGSSRFLQITEASVGAILFGLAVTNTGILQLQNGAGTQIGSNGTTLVNGLWYRISIAFTITSTTVNRFEVFVNGVSNISVTNGTISTTISSNVLFGSLSGDASFNIRGSDFYIDNSSSLTDTGDIWVTAKRPNVNGTTNGFATQIGAGGSGYGSGHSPQVNERPLSTTNGWSMIGAGSAITEEYNIEGLTVGDFSLLNASIIDYVGWVSASALASETASIIVNGASSNISLTSTITFFTKIAGSTTYPAGTGADIGIITATTLTTVSLYEAGVLVAFIPGATLPKPPQEIPRSNWAALKRINPIGVYNVGDSIKVIIPIPPPTGIAAFVAPTNIPAAEKISVVAY